MSFYTTEEQVYELFSRAGEIKKIIMGLDKNTKTPCGFCFILYYSREDAADSVKYISGTILDDSPIRVDFDWGFQEGRQWGRGKSGGQVRDEYHTDYDPDILLMSLTLIILLIFIALISGVNPGGIYAHEKNPRFRERGDFDGEEDDDRKRRPWQFLTARM